MAMATGVTMVSGSVVHILVMGMEKEPCSAEGGGFPLANGGFNPGHAGHALYSGGGGGRYGIRDHPRGWAPHRPTFEGHVSRGFISSEGATVAGGSRGSRHWLGLDQVRSRDRQPHEQAESKETASICGMEPVIGQMQVGSLAQACGLNVAGMPNIPEHVAHLMQQTFDAMKEAQSSKPLELEDCAALVEKKTTTQLEVIEKMSKLPLWRCRNHLNR
jgi:hypothetical protein